MRVSSLGNGVTVALDPMPSVRSCSIGVWLLVGSRHEQAREYGLTHFIEHMLFKGTRRYGALELADELNRLGQANAMTSQESLCLYAQCVDYKAPRTLELLCDMLLESTYPLDEIRRERNVILEEYKMYEDTPDELIYDLFFQNMWPSSPLGRPVIGTPSSIRSFSHGGIQKFLAREFDPARVLIVISGQFEAESCRRKIRKAFARLPRRNKKRYPPLGTVKPKMRRTSVRRDVEQVHFCFGSHGPHRASRDRYAFGLLNMMLGGSMSSRLFKEVREKRGLAYSIQSFVQPFHRAGSFGIAGSTSPGSVDEVVAICADEVRRICIEPVDEAELGLHREQIIDSVLLGTESTYARMMRLSESLISFGRPISPEATIRNIQAVTPGDIRRVARKYLFRHPVAASLIGPEGIHTKMLPRIFE